LLGDAGSLPTTTPTPTTETEELVTISVNVDRGSTVLSFNASSPNNVSEDTDITFNYVLSRKDGTTRTVPVTITINEGNRKGSSVITLKDEDFDNIDNDVQSFKNLTSTNSNLSLGYGEKTVDGVNESMVNYTFVSCCDRNEKVVFEIPSRSVDKFRGVVKYKGSCYSISERSKDGRPVARFFGPDFSSCKVSDCECTPKPTPTPTTGADLGKMYTLTSFSLISEGVVNRKVDKQILVNLKNSHSNFEIISYNGYCYRKNDSVEQQYSTGQNDYTKPVIDSSDLHISEIACKAKLSNSLNAEISITSDYSHVSKP